MVLYRDTCHTGMEDIMHWSKSGWRGGGVINKPCCIKLKGYSQTNGYIIIKTVLLACPLLWPHLFGVVIRHHDLFGVH